MNVFAVFSCFCYFRVSGNEGNAGLQTGLQVWLFFEDSIKKLEMTRKCCRWVRLLLLAGTMLGLASCKSNYYFPGGNTKNRRPAKGCNCPGYVGQTESGLVRGGDCLLFPLAKDSAFLLLAQRPGLVDGEEASLVPEL